MRGHPPIDQTPSQADERCGLILLSHSQNKKRDSGAGSRLILGTDELASETDLQGFDQIAACVTAEEIDHSIGKEGAITQAILALDHTFRLSWLPGVPKSTIPPWTPM